MASLPGCAHVIIPKIAVDATSGARVHATASYDMIAATATEDATLTIYKKKSGEAYEVWKTFPIPAGQGWYQRLTWKVEKDRSKKLKVRIKLELTAISCQDVRAEYPWVEDCVERKTKRARVPERLELEVEGDELEVQ